MIPARASAAIVVVPQTVETVAIPYAMRVRPVPQTAGAGFRRHGEAHPTIVAEISQRYRIDPLLLHAIVSKESAFRPGAVSPKGALGLMQVMPATAHGLGVVDSSRLLTDPEYNLATGATYLKVLQRQFGNDVPTILAAYNAGPGAVRRYGRIPPFAETRDYVTTIMGRYASARALVR